MNNELIFIGLRSVYLLHIELNFALSRQPVLIMKNTPSDTVTEAWVSLFTAHTSVFEYAQQQLKKNGCPPLSWYDVLWELDKAGEQGLRPFKLEELILFKTQYSVSRVISRMEKAEYVTKIPHEQDGRGHTVVITPLGKQVRLEMWQTYSEAINTAMGDKLSEQECIALKGLLTKLYQ